MTDEGRSKLVDYLSNHSDIQLATSDANCKPRVRTVHYVNEDSVVYFMTEKTASKVETIKNNPNVSYTVTEDYASLPDIQGVEVEGSASLVEDSEELQKVQGLMIQKFPDIKNMPPMELVCMKIIAEKGVFIDNPAGFGTRLDVDF